MNRQASRMALAGLVALVMPAALAAQAAPAPAPPAAAAPRPATQRVLIETALGPITIEVETERAPVTSANFLRYVDQRLDRPGTAFVAVGAGHLAGKGSVIERLEAAGLEVARVQ